MLELVDAGGTASLWLAGAFRNRHAITFLSLRISSCGAVITVGIPRPSYGNYLFYAITYP